MTSLFSRTLISAGLPIIMMTAGSQSLSAQDLQVIGSLQAHGPIQITTDTAEAPIRLADTTYAYLTGDTVRTGRGTALLKVAGMGRVGFAENTEASVIESGEGMRVALGSGALAYNLAPGSGFTVEAAGMTIRPSRSPIQQVGADTGGDAVGWVAIGEDGEVKVGSRSGEVEITRGGTRQVVAAGEQSVLQYQGGRLIATQLLGAGAGAGLTGIDIAMLVVMVGAIGFAGVQIADDTNGDTGAVLDGSIASP